jgi:hypothetical protein
MFVFHMHADSVIVNLNVVTFVLHLSTQHITYIIITRAGVVDTNRFHLSMYLDITRMTILCIWGLGGSVVGASGSNLTRWHDGESLRKTPYP